MQPHQDQPGAFTTTPPALPEKSTGLPPPPARSTAWRWYLCALLFLATTINYLDRQTLANVSKRIKTELELSNEQYGELETGFGLAFAAGAFCFGMLADRVGVFWLYPAVLLLWSAIGFLTGLVGPFSVGPFSVSIFASLLLCRTCLGFFEAGHWPCALKTTQRLLPPKDRALANSLLQGGTSIGAFLTPIIVLAFLNGPGSWRPPFLVIGAVGTLWIVLWLVSIRPADLNARPPQDRPDASPPDEEPFLTIVFSRRFLVLISITIAINTSWHVFRVWMTTFLIEGRGYNETEEAIPFNSVYYLATEVGVLSAGTLAWLLVRGGVAVHRARTLVYAGCAVLMTLTTALAFFPKGWPLLAVLMVIGFANLGLFPFYYSFSQELTVKHQGKVSGLLGVFAWVVPAVVHKFLGRYVDATKSYDLPLALVGWLPLLSLVLLLTLWGRNAPREPRSGNV